MPSDPRSGIRAALDAAGASEPLAAPPETGDLFADADDPAGWGSPLSGTAVFSDGVKRRGPGRPAGARNRTTREMVEFILARYPHPLIGLAEIVATPPAKLALALQRMGEDGQPIGTPDKDDRRWAFEFWRSCAFELSEYLATKQPRQLQTEDGLPPIFQVFMGGPGQGAAPGMAPMMGMPKNLANSMELVSDAAEVPREEVPQIDAPAADATGPELSGS